jgi:cytochrome c-type biogenesis protein CcmH/NrfG
MSARFCATCGTKAVPGANFCAECGARHGAHAAAASGWRLTGVGAGVLVGFLGAGLAVWTMILSPSTPRPGPGAGAPRAAAAGGPPHPRVELPAEVKTFITDLSAKAKAKPQDVETWMRLAQVEARASQLDPSYQGDAIAAFEHVLELDAKNADALRGLANMHYDRDDHQKAIPIYERYLALRPDDQSARTDLATMYLYSGQPERAIATYQDVIRQNPSFLQAHYNLAVTYHGQGNDPEALKELEVARRLAGDDSVRKQIDDMIASLKGGPPTGDAAPVAAAGVPSPAPAGDRSPFQAAVEDAFRGAPIMGARIVRFDWAGPGNGRVLVQNFPIEAMPEEVRGKFTSRLQQELRTAEGAHPVDGPVKLEIADAGSGSVMATITP